MIHKLVAFLCLAGVAQSAAQDFSADELPRSLNLLPQLRHLQWQSAPSRRGETEPPAWYIGAGNPDETVVITGSQTQVGDIIILNRGKLLVQGGALRLNGDLLVTGAGTFEVDGGSLEIAQRYLYEHRAVVADSGRWIMNDATFKSSRLSWSIGVARHARYSMVRTVVKEGFITHAVLDSAQIEVSDMRFAGEFLSFHNSSMHFSGVDTLLIWLVLPEGSVVDQALPGATLVPSWRFATGEPGVQGIPYEINVDSCRSILWGVISMTGSSSTFRQSTLRAIGLFFAGNNTVRVNNLVNGSSHRDDLIPVPDRDLRLIDSQVNTWSFYPSAGSKVEISNCLFGEILMQDSSYALVDNSICDGSGGYVSAFGRAFLILFRTLVQSPVISRDSGIIVGAQSAFLGNVVTADESSAMALLNTSFVQEPVAYTAAVIFDEKLPSVRTAVGEVVPLLGSARMLVGPQHPLQYEGYEIDYALNFDENSWTSIVPRRNVMVREDTLGVWNTAGLPAGVHGLRLRLFGDFGEPITLVSSAQLYLPTGVDTEELVMPATCTLDNYPNPFNAATRLKFTMPSAGLVRLRIFNLNGQEVTRLLETPLAPGVHTVDWQVESLSSGIYFAVLESKGRKITRQVMLMK